MGGFGKSLRFRECHGPLCHLNRLESLSYLVLRLLSLAPMVASRLPSPPRFLQLSGLRVVTRVLRLAPRLLSPVSPCLTVPMCPDVLRKVPLASPEAELLLPPVFLDEGVACEVDRGRDVVVPMVVVPFPLDPVESSLAFVKLGALVGNFPLPPTVLITLRQLRILLGRRCIPLLSRVNRRLAMCLSRHWLRDMITNAFG